MESELYKVTKKDLPKLQALLNKCFASDPLYETLIPNEDIRKKLLPKLFACDMEEFYKNCDIFADSPDLNGLLVVSDETEPYHFLQYYFTELEAELQTDAWLIKEDPSLRTLFHFFAARDYLNSHWTTQLHEDNRLHVIYLAVDPQMQHHGIAVKLLKAAVDYADNHHMMMSLETHNPNNVTLYQQFGFEIYEVLEKHFHLKQFCMVRPIQSEVGQPAKPGNAI